MEVVGLYILICAFVTGVVCFAVAERHAGKTAPPDSQPSSQDGEDFIRRMAEAIDDHRDAVAASEDDWSHARVTQELAAFERMLAIRREYYSTTDSFGDRTSRRLDQMIDDEIDRPQRERAARATAEEAREIETGAILKHARQAVIDFAPEGVLVRISTTHHGPVRFLRVHNGTVNPDGSREEYGICVPNECETVKAALAWTYGIAPGDYAEAART